MIILRNERLSNTFLAVQVSLQSSKHIFYFKAILAFEIKCISKGRDDFIVSWKPENDSLCKVREIDIIIVG